MVDHSFYTQGGDREQGTGEDEQVRAIRTIRKERIKMHEDATRTITKVTKQSKIKVISLTLAPLEITPNVTKHRNQNGVRNNAKSQQRQTANRDHNLTGTVRILCWAQNLRYEGEENKMEVADSG